MRLFNLGICVAAASCVASSVGLIIAVCIGTAPAPDPPAVDAVAWMPMPPLSTQRVEATIVFDDFRLTPDESESGYVGLTIRATNTTDDPIQYQSFDVSALDNAGDIIETTVVTTPNLPAGESRRIGGLFMAPASAQAASFRVTEIKDADDDRGSTL